MKLLSKKNLIVLLSICVFTGGCLNFDDPPKGFTISDDKKALIRKFATENGYPETMPIDSFVRYVYDKWPNETDRIDFFLTFPKQNATPKMLVLSDVLTFIGKSVRVHYEPAPYGGVISSANIDTIQIITDSVIVLPGLNLSYCNLTHLPSKIGKIRVSSLDVRNNYRTLNSIPDELMLLSESPKYWNTLIVNYDIGAVQAMSSVSDSLKLWLQKHETLK